MVIDHPYIHGPEHGSCIFALWGMNAVVIDAMHRIHVWELIANNRAF